MRRLPKILAGLVLACLLLPHPVPASSLPVPTDILDNALEETPAVRNDETAQARFVPPPDNQYDWLQLKSNEWLKGHLKSLYNYKVEFDSDKLNLLTFKWKDVKRLRTAAPRSVRVETTRYSWHPLTVIGRIEMRDDTVVILSGKRQQRYRRDQIVSIGSIGEREREYWSGKFSLGANLRAGNADVVDVSLITNTKRQDAHSRFVGDYVGNYSQARGEINTNSHRLNVHFDRFQSSRFFWRVLNGEYYRDVPKNIAHQASIGTAFGFDLIRNGKTEWELSGGLGVSDKRYVSVEAGGNRQETSPSLRLGTLYDTSFSKNTDFLINYSFQLLDKASGSYTHHFISTLSSEILPDLDIDVSLIWDRVQDPRPDANGIVPRRDDYQLVVGIGYEF